MMSYRSDDWQLADEARELDEHERLGYPLADCPIHPNGCPVPDTDLASQNTLSPASGPTSRRVRAARLDAWARAIMMLLLGLVFGWALTTLVGRL